MTNRATLLFSDMDTVETDILSFDFSKRLLPLETLQTATFTMNVVTGSDSAPDSMKVGVPKAYGPLAMQKVAPKTPGVKYEIRCVVTTSSNRELVEVATMSTVSL